MERSRDIYSDSGRDAILYARIDTGVCIAIEEAE